MTGGEDNGLVQNALRGSEKAFRKLVVRYQRIVYSVVLGIVGNRPEVEDIVQEVFIKIYKGLHGFRGESKLSTWIYRIARNESLNAAAKLRSNHRPLEEVVSVASPHGNPEEAFGSRQARERLHRLIARLDEHYRVVIELRYLGEKSYAEIAEIMDIPVGTVKTYIHRAKTVLKDLLTAESAREGKKGYGIK